MLTSRTCDPCLNSRGSLAFRSLFLVSHESIDACLAWLTCSLVPLGSRLTCRARRMAHVATSRTSGWFRSRAPRAPLWSSRGSAHVLHMPVHSSSRGLTHELHVGPGASGAHVGRLTCSTCPPIASSRGLAHELHVRPSASSALVGRLTCSTCPPLKTPRGLAHVLHVGPTAVWPLVRWRTCSTWLGFGLADPNPNPYPIRIACARSFPALA